MGRHFTGIGICGHYLGHLVVGAYFFFPSLLSGPVSPLLGRAFGDSGRALSARRSEPYRFQYPSTFYLVFFTIQCLCQVRLDLDCLVVYQYRFLDLDFCPFGLPRWGQWHHLWAGQLSFFCRNCAKKPQLLGDFPCGYFFL